MGEKCGAIFMKMKLFGIPILDSRLNASIIRDRKIIWGMPHDNRLKRSNRRNRPNRSITITGITQRGNRRKNLANCRVFGYFKFLIPLKDFVRGVP
jgi:hypothetical protein